MMVALALIGAWGPALTLHIYVRPSPPQPPGFRIFGFPRPLLKVKAHVEQSHLGRKALLFFFSVAMIVGGLWLLGAQLFYAEKIYGLIVVAGVTPIFFGVYLLWSDFVAPLLGISSDGGSK
jgi:hypothetical protein